MTSVAELESLYTAAVAAMDSGDYLTAKQGFLKVMARRAVTPDLEQSLGTAGRQSIKWRDVDLTSLIAECDKMLAASRTARRGPISTIPIRYKRPSATDSY